MERSAISEDGTALAIRASGAGAPVVFVHGTAADGTRWDPVAALLEGTLCLGYDRRGRGDSGDTLPYGLDREIDDLLAVMAAAGSPVDVVAHSFGALVAIEAARRAPERFRRLVAYEAPLAAPEGPAFIDLDKVAALEQVFAEEGPEAAVVYFQRHFPRATEAEIAAMRQMPIWPARIAAAHTIARELRAIAARPADAAAFADWRVPTLILLGGASPPPFQTSAAWLVATLADAASSIVPDERHRAMDTAPAAVAARLREFWRLTPA